MSEVTVTTVFISEAAIKLLILEQTEKSEVQSISQRLVSKRREIKRLQRESEVIEQELISKIKSMELRGISFY